MKNDSIRVQHLCGRIESYGFECEAGPLENCLEWQELKRFAADLASALSVLEEEYNESVNANGQFGVGA